MNMMSQLAVLFVAILHGYFLVLEMFLWDKPIGLTAFRQTKERAVSTKVLAANQGLYNGFIAAGLLWGVLQGAAGYQFKVFFLICVVIAGVYGSITVSRKILYIQAMPGLIALLLTYLAR